MQSPPPVHRSRHPFFAPILAFLLSASLLITGCTTLLNAPLPGASPVPPSLVVHVGDEVRIQTKTGQIQAFEVTAIETDAFVGAKARVKFDEINVLQVRRTDKRATILTVAIVVAVVLLVGVAAAVAEAGPGITGG